MKIYTRTGDRGETSTCTGKRLEKDHPLMEAYGTLDELNSFLGLAASFSKRKKAAALVAEAQKKVFEIGSALCSEKPGVAKADVRRLEKEIDAMEKRLKPLKHFIIPSGTQGACAFHTVRTVCRRAERRLVSAGKKGVSLAYLNRLSDLLFMLARYENYGKGVGEKLWKGKK